MKKAFYLIFFIISTILCLRFLQNNIVDNRIINQGKVVIGEVKGMPDCGNSSNTMKVFYNKKSYLVNIGKNKCINGEYENGQKVKVVYSKIYDKILMPYSNTKFSIGLSIFCFAIPLMCLYNLIRREK
ncbi:MAG: hypothetical protein AAGK97_18685 [Bacteroidota bacterium]